MRASLTDYSSLSSIPKIDILIIGGAPVDYKSNPYYVKFFGNHQNTPLSHLNEGDFASILFLVIAFW